MALDFDAVGDRLTTAAFAVPSSVTMTAWIKDPPLANGGPRIFENGGPTVRFFFGSGGELTFHRRFSGATANWSVSYANLGSPDLTQWHHVAVTFDGSSTANDPVIYFDGVARTVTETVAPSGSVDVGSQVMNLGNASFNGRQAGALAWLGIYSAVLTAGQIQQAMEFGYYPASLLALWSLEVDGATFPDLSGNGWTATKAGAPVFVADPTLAAGPEGSKVLDTFDRADAELNTGNWSADTYGFTNSGLHIVGNKAASTTGLDQRSYWDTTTFGPDCAVFTMVSTPPASGERLNLAYRVQTPATASADGYEMRVINTTGTFEWRLFSVLNQSYNTEVFVASGPVLAAGDGVACVVHVSTHTVYHRPAGGVWAEVMSATDSSVTAAGYIGLAALGTTGRYDQFGGGTTVDVTAPGPVTSLVASEPVSGTIRLNFTMPASVDTAIYRSRYKVGLGQTFSGPTDGTEFVPDTSAGPSTNRQVDWPGFTPGQSYTIGVWAGDEVPNFSTVATDDLTLAGVAAELAFAPTMNADMGAVRVYIPLPAIDASITAATAVTEGDPIPPAELAFAPTMSASLEAVRVIELLGIDRGGPQEIIGPLVGQAPGAVLVRNRRGVSSARTISRLPRGRRRR